MRILILLSLPLALCLTALEVTVQRPHVLFTADDLSRLRQHALLNDLRSQVLQRGEPATAEDFLLRISNLLLARHLLPDVADSATEQALALLGMGVPRLQQARGQRSLATLDGFDVQTVLTSTALAYDGLHDALNDQQRRELRALLLEWGEWIASHFDRRDGWANNDFGNHKTANLACVTAIACALLPDERRALPLLRHCIVTWRRDVFPAIAVHGGEDGGWGEGIGYNTGQATHVINAIDFIRHTSGENLWPEVSWLDDNGDFILQLRQPDGTFLPWADMWTDRPTWREAMLLGRYARATGRERYHQGMAELRDHPDFQDDARAVGWRLLWEPSGPAPQNTPLDTFASFDGIGLHVARSSWQQDAGFVSFRCGPVISVHQHADQNAFTLFHQAPLALDAGVYDDFWSAHSFNFYRRSIAHNTLVVIDPSEEFQAADKLLRRNNRGRARNDGGQYRFNPELYEIATWRRHQAEWEAAHTITATAFDGGAYFHGEAGRAYREAKLSRFDRQVIALWSDAGHRLIIRDRIDRTRPDLDARLLLQLDAAPQREAAGQWRSDPPGPALLRVHALHGIGDIQAVGSAGVFLVDGAVMEPERTPRLAPPAGGWRLELPVQGDEAIWILHTGRIDSRPMLEREADGWRLEDGETHVMWFDDGRVRVRRQDTALLVSDR